MPEPVQLDLDEANQQIAEVQKQTEPPAKKAEEQEETVFRQEVMVNGRKLAFEDPTAEGLLRQVAAALEASQSAPEKKEDPKPVVQPKLTEDELFKIGADIQAGKVEAIDTYVEKSGLLERLLEKRGVKLETLKKAAEREVSAEQASNWQTATADFLAAHPDYVGTETNKELMGMYLTAHQLPPSVESIETAYKHFSEQGLLQTETPEKKEVVPVKKKATGSSIFGTGQTGGERQKKPTMSTLEADIAKLAADMKAGKLSALDFAQAYNQRVAEEMSGNA